MQNTCAYNSYFVLLWSTNILAIPGALTLLGFSIRWSVPHAHNETLPEEEEAHLGQSVVGYAFTVLLLTYVVLLRLHAPRVLIRAGAFPALCRGDVTPTTERELVDAVSSIYAQYKRPPSVVGSAWGFFIQRYGPPAPRLFLHNYKGRDPDAFKRKRWLAGTTIASCAKRLLAEEGVTFPSHPTMDYISLGAWFGFGNHGNGGDENTGSSKCLKNARVLNMITGDIETLEYPELRRRFDGVGDHDPKDYCILDVAFKGLVPNQALEKRGIIIDSAEAASEWLSPGAVLRVCFQGAARDYAIALRWMKAPNKVIDHPHLCSRFCMYTQVDICSVCCGWHEPIRKFTGVMNHYNANRWMPTVWPLETVTVVLSGFRNFELVFLLGKTLDGNTLFKLITNMIAIHKEVGGRSEVRYGKPGPNTPVFLDCAFNRGSNRVFEMLRRDFGIKETALHPGKHTRLSTAPLIQVPLAKVYGMTSGA